MKINLMKGWQIRYMIDYHIHPDFSIDAEEYSIDDYCKQAVRLKLHEICFTPHFEFDPIRKELDWFVRLKGNQVSIFSSWLEEYFRQINQAKETYKPLGLQVKAGLEIGYDLGLEESIAKVTQNYPFDFILGSVHCVDHIAISSAQESEKYFPNQALSQVCKKYFYTLQEGLNSGLFHVVGHIDIYRRYGQKYFGSEINNVYLESLPSILDLMAKKNIGMEVNTSSLGQGQGEFYPSSGILKLAKERGVKIFTTGSDAHKLKDLGRGIPDATGLLNELGLSISTFDQGKPSFKV